MEVLGHAQIGTTMNIYAHIAPEFQKEYISEQRYFIMLFRHSLSSGRGVERDRFIPTDLLQW